MGKDEKGYEKRRQLAVIASLLIVVAVMVWVTVQIGEPLVRWAQEPEQFQRWIEGKGAWGRLAFLGIQMLQVVIAMIPGEVFEIGAGYAFGAVEATLLCMAGTVVGSTLIFALTRVLGVKLVEAFISREKIHELKWLQNTRRLNNMIFWVFFIPGTPKDLLTYFVGLTPMKLSTFLVISTLARIPSIVSSTFGGHALGDQNYGLAIIIFAATGLISFLGKLIYDKLMKRGQEKHKEKQ